MKNCHPTIIPPQLTRRPQHHPIIIPLSSNYHPGIISYFAFACHSSHHHPLPRTSTFRKKMACYLHEFSKWDDRFGGRNIPSSSNHFGAIDIYHPTPPGRTGWSSYSSIIFSRPFGRTPIRLSITIGWRTRRIIQTTRASVTVAIASDRLPGRIWFRDDTSTKCTLRPYLFFWISCSEHLF